METREGVFSFRTMLNWFAIISYLQPVVMTPEVSARVAEKGDAIHAVEVSIFLCFLASSILSIHQDVVVKGVEAGAVVKDVVVVVTVMEQCIFVKTVC